LTDENLSQQSILFWKPYHQKRETYSSVDIGILTAFHQLQGGMK